MTIEEFYMESQDQRYKESVHFRISKPVLQQLQQEADKRGLTLSETIRFFVETGLEA